MKDQDKSNKPNGSIPAQEEQLNAIKLRAEELQRLVSLPGWKYAKDVAGVFLSEYQCRPPKAGEDAKGWETYTTMKWILDRTFTTVELIAAAPKLEPPRQVRQVTKRR